MEEEILGLGCPALDDEDIFFAVGLGPNFNFDLAGEVFFHGIDTDDHESASNAHGSSQSLDGLNRRRHGKGKEMRIVEQPKNIINAFDRDTKTRPKDVQTNKVSMTGSSKSKILDDASLELKFEATKRKLHEEYENLARERKRRQIQVLSLLELPKIPNEKCRPVKFQNRFSHKRVNMTAPAIH